jgi:ubiquitin carboxyl-terminal hydrolase 7
MSESDLQFYIANKELLESKHGFATKRTGEFAGLRNHGATCYLNSLIQCLFHDSEFVKLIMETSDNPDSAIITEMKKLFARLIMSTNQAIDTESLLTAFGWSKSQLFEQHDIHELFSVLLDALGKDSASLNAGITKLFQGHMTG